jgi:hypothetical protein
MTPTDLARMLDMLPPLPWHVDGDSIVDANGASVVYPTGFATGGCGIDYANGADVAIVQVMNALPGLLAEPALTEEPAARNAFTIAPNAFTLTEPPMERDMKSTMEQAVQEMVDAQEVCGNEGIGPDMDDTINKLCTMLGIARPEVRR